MVRSVAKKVMWVGRATAFLVGLAVMLALVLGVATTALASAPGDPFRLGQTNGIDAMSTLVGNVAGTMLRVDNNSTEKGATALDLRVEPGKPPMKVNSATRVANLNADKLDSKDSTDFLGKSEKAADAAHADSADHATSADSATSANSAGDANTLDGKDSTEFAAANHNHDSSYIQQSPTSAEDASINITGTLRTSGMLRIGSETGTSESPALNCPSACDGVYDGLVVRRINSTNSGAGQVVARTDKLRLERDGTYGGLRIAWDANTGNTNTVNCMGINNAGAPVNYYSRPVSNSAVAGMAQVYTDAQNVVYATCSFGDAFAERHVTQVTWQRMYSDNLWVGTVISTFNQ